MPGQVKNDLNHHGVGKQCPEYDEKELMKKSDIENIARQYSLAPNRKLGQNFLVDDQMVAKLVRLVDPSGDDIILEIGPGLGALTAGLAAKAGGLTVVEIDAGFCRYLKDSVQGEVKIIHGDFCKLPREEIPQGVTKAVSNLPYYCASEILFRIATEIFPPHVFVMMQKEMADRLKASPGTKSYGAMTVSLGYYYRIVEPVPVTRESFYPRPDVASTFLHLQRRDEYHLGKRDLNIFHLLVKSAFWGRRKTIIKSLADSPHMDLSRSEAALLLERCGIDHKQRGEELHLHHYIEMARNLGAMRQRAGT